jgi:hypothetical protein
MHFDAQARRGNVLVLETVRDVAHRFAVCMLFENPAHDGCLGGIDLALAWVARAAIAEGDAARDKAVADPPSIDRFTETARFLRNIELTMPPTPIWTSETTPGAAFRGLDQAGCRGPEAHRHHVRRQVLVRHGIGEPVAPMASWSH